MPGFVRTEEDEKKWQKAKKIVQEQHGSISWPLVTHIFNQMKKGEEIKDPRLDPEYTKKLDAIDVQIRRKKLEQKGIPTLPTKEEKQSKELDDLGKALKVLRDSIEILNKANKEVDPAAAFSPEEMERMRPWVEKGFNHQEAAHLTGVRQIPYSLKSQRKSSEMSDAMLQHAKNYASKHVQKLRQMRGESAEAHHNPVIFEHHHREKITSDLGKGLKEFLNEYKSSGALDSMQPHEKSIAIRNKTKEWYANNKEQEHQKTMEASKKIKEVHDQATAARQFELLQQRQHMLSGGTTVEPSEYDELPEDVDYSKEDEDLI